MQVSRKEHWDQGSVTVMQNATVVRLQRRDPPVMMAIQVGDDFKAKQEDSSLLGTPAPGPLWRDNAGGTGLRTAEQCPHDKSTVTQNGIAKGLVSTLVSGTPVP